MTVLRAVSSSGLTRVKSKVIATDHGEGSREPTLEEYAELVRSSASGDTEALDRLLVHAQEVAWRFSNSVCGRQDDAEDAMQEALIKTYRYIGRIREPAAFKPWLYRTVKNACLMGRRKKAGEPMRLLSLDDPAFGHPHRGVVEARDPGRSPEQLAEDARLRGRLRHAVLTLPVPYRAVVFLREMQGLSTREVARVMGVSEDNVKTRLRRARARIQATLEASEG